MAWSALPCPSRAASPRRPSGTRAAPTRAAAGLRGAARGARALVRRDGGVPGRSDARAVAALGSGSGRALRLASCLQTVGGRKPSERLLAPEQLEALEEPRRDGEPVI